MIACFDVDYHEAGASAAAVVFRDWDAGTAVAEYVVAIENIVDYIPGQFYKRELPCLLEVLQVIHEPIDLLVIDGYVWLDGECKAQGLGAHLYAAMEEKTPVVGVAKTNFATATAAVPVCRGTSKTPLLVTAVGVDIDAAVDGLKRMHGQHRIPTLLKRVDRLCRTGTEQANDSGSP